MSAGDLALFRGGGGGGFQQQGSVDWAAVMNGSVSFTVNTLSRLSKAGIEVLTFCAARVMFSQMKLGRTGEIRLQQALDRAQAYPTLNKALWFGFGVKHIIKTLQETVEGLSCIGICASLTEMYSTDVAAKIVQELFSLLKPPSDLTPALRQWLALVEACQGVLATSEFGLIVHQLSKVYLRDGLPNKRHCGPPKAIAEVLKAVIDVSQARLERIDITGGPDCAWIAAVAYWLLDLPVEIRDSSGEVFYRPGDVQNTSARPAQVVITYDRELQVRNSEVSRKYYLIGSGSFLNYDIYAVRDHEKLLAYGRLSWETCLIDTFGTPMRELLGPVAATTGGFLGAALGIYQRIMEDDMGKATITPRQWNHLLGHRLTPGSYGTGFILTARGMLPESIANPVLLQTMEDIARLPFPVANETYLECLRTLCEACQCADCRLAISKSECSDEDSDEDPSEDPDKDSDDDSHEHLGKERQRLRYCLLDLAATAWRLLIRIASSRGIGDFEIRPTLSGIESFHEAVVSTKECPWNRRKILVKSEELKYDLGSFIHSPMFPGSEPGSYHHLVQTVALFTGRMTDRSLSGRSATCVNGLCFYLATLTDISSDPVAACQIKVVPGHIEWRDICYDKVMDGNQGGKLSKLKTYEATGSGREPLSMSNASLVSTDYATLTPETVPMNSDLIIQEEDIRERVLGAFYRVRTIEQSSPGREYCVLPSRVFYDLLSAYSPRNCRGRRCQSANGKRGIVFKGFGHIRNDTVSGWVESNYTVPVVHILDNNPLSVWVAMSRPFRGWVRGKGPSEPEERLWMFDCNYKLQGDQCLACCITRAVPALPRQSEGPEVSLWVCLVTFPNR